MKKEDIDRLRAYAIATDTTDKYVILMEDDEGRYITYALKDGHPHDNRCLSWYDSLQPNALLMNHHNIEDWNLHEVGGLYYLHEMSCGRSNESGEEHCSPGHPCVRCLTDGWLKNGNWSYKEPVKCACWLLEPIDEEFIGKQKLTVDQAVKFTEIYCNKQTIK